MVDLHHSQKFLIRLDNFHMKQRQTMRTTGSHPNKGAALLVVLAFLFNLAAGYTLPSSADAAIIDAGISTGGGVSTVVICSPNGIRVMRLGPDGEPLPEPQHANLSCVHCLSLSGNHGCNLCTRAETVGPLPSPGNSFSRNTIDTLISLAPSDTHAIRAPPRHR